MGRQTALPASELGEELVKFLQNITVMAPRQFSDNSVVFHTWPFSLDHSVRWRSPWQFCGSCLLPTPTHHPSSPEASGKTVWKPLGQQPAWPGLRPSCYPHSPPPSLPRCWSASGLGQQTVPPPPAARPQLHKPLSLGRPHPPSTFPLQQPNCRQF